MRVPANMEIKAVKCPLVVLTGIGPFFFKY